MSKLIRPNVEHKKKHFLVSVPSSAVNVQVEAKNAAGDIIVPAKKIAVPGRNTGGDFKIPFGELHRGKGKMFGAGAHTFSFIALPTHGSTTNEASDPTTLDWDLSAAEAHELNTLMAENGNGHGNGGNGNGNNLFSSKFGKVFLGAVVLFFLLVVGYVAYDKAWRNKPQSSSAKAPTELDAETVEQKAEHNARAEERAKLEKAEEKVAALEKQNAELKAKVAPAEAAEDVAIERSAESGQKLGDLLPLKTNALKRAEGVIREWRRTNESRGGTYVVENNTVGDHTVFAVNSLVIQEIVNASAWDPRTTNARVMFMTNFPFGVWTDVPYTANGTAFIVPPGEKAELAEKTLNDPNLQKYYGDDRGGQEFNPDPNVKEGIAPGLKGLFRVVVIPSDAIAVDASETKVLGFIKIRRLKYRR